MNMCPRLESDDAPRRRDTCGLKGINLKQDADRQLTDPAAMVVPEFANIPFDLQPRRQEYRAIINRRGVQRSPLLSMDS